MADYQFWQPGSAYRPASVGDSPVIVRMALNIVQDNVARAFSIAIASNDPFNLTHSLLISDPFDGRVRSLLWPGYSSELSDLTPRIIAWTSVTNLCEHDRRAIQTPDQPRITLLAIASSDRDSRGNRKYLQVVGLMPTIPLYPNPDRGLYPVTPDDDADPAFRDIDDQYAGQTQNVCATYIGVTQIARYFSFPWTNDLSRFQQPSEPLTSSTSAFSNFVHGTGLRKHLNSSVVTPACYYDGGFDNTL